MTKNYSGIQDRVGIIFLCIVAAILGTATSTILVCKFKKLNYLPNL